MEIFSLPNLVDKVILKSGELQLNQGNLSGKGTLEKEGGFLTGTGSLADDKKLDLTINENQTIDKKLTIGTSVDPKRYFNIPTECGALSYAVSEENAGGRAHLDENNKLVADSVGIIKLKVTSASTNFYRSAEKEIELTVEKGTLTGVSVEPYSGIYDGKEHDALTVMVGGEEPSADMTIEYAKTGTESFSTEMPKVTDCADSGTTYQVRLSSDTYETELIRRKQFKSVHMI